MRVAFGRRHSHHWSLLTLHFVSCVPDGRRCCALACSMGINQSTDTGHTTRTAWLGLLGGGVASDCNDCESTGWASVGPCATGLIRAEGKWVGAVRRVSGVGRGSVGWCHNLRDGLMCFREGGRPTLPYTPPTPPYSDPYNRVGTVVVGIRVGLSSQT